MWILPRLVERVHFLQRLLHTGWMQAVSTRGPSNGSTLKSCMYMVICTAAPQQQHVIDWMLLHNSNSPSAHVILISMSDQVMSTLGGQSTACVDCCINMEQPWATRIAGGWLIGCQVIAPLLCKNPTLKLSMISFTLHNSQVFSTTCCAQIELTQRLCTVQPNTQQDMLTTWCRWYD
jgi:hypothetical protein